MESTQATIHARRNADVVTRSPLSRTTGKLNFKAKIQVASRPVDALPNGPSVKVFVEARNDDADPWLPVPMSRGGSVVLDGEQRWKETIAVEAEVQPETAVIRLTWRADDGEVWFEVIQLR